MVGLHPDIEVANLSRPIRSKIVWNNSRGTATSAIWKTIFREWRTTFAPILISFSRSVTGERFKQGLVIGARQKFAAEFSEFRIPVNDAVSNHSEFRIVRQFSAVILARFVAFEISFVHSIFKRLPIPAVLVGKLQYFPQRNLRRGEFAPERQV